MPNVNPINCQADQGLLLMWAALAAAGIAIFA